MTIPNFAPPLIGSFRFGAFCDMIFEAFLLMGNDFRGIKIFRIIMRTTTSPDNQISVAQKNGVAISCGNADDVARLRGARIRSRERKSAREESPDTAGQDSP